MQYGIERVIQPLIQRVLLREGISQTEISWDDEEIDDTSNLTASWPKEQPKRSVHVWTRGNWPRLPLEVEGTVWEDDEYNLQRCVRFLTLHSPEGGPAASIALEGSAANPIAKIIPQRRFNISLRQLAADLKGIQLGPEDPVFPLQPRPPHR